MYWKFNMSFKNGASIFIRIIIAYVRVLFIKLSSFGVDYFNLSSLMIPVIVNA